MSVAIEAPSVRPRLRVPLGRRGAAWALARIEGRRLVRHPIFLGGVLLSLTAFVLATWSQAPVLHRDDILIGFTLVPLAAATLLAANLAALRSRRHGTEELYGSNPTPPEARTLGHLGSVWWAVGVAALVVLGEVTYLALFDPVGRPSPFELLVGPVLVALGGSFGILVVRGWPSIVAGPVSLVAILALAFMFFSSMANAPAPHPDRFLLPWAPLTLGGQPARELVVRPAGWHLLYVLALVLLVASLAVLSHAFRPGVAGLGAAALALVVLTASIQVRGPTDRQADKVSQLFLTPERFRVCQTFAAVRYCAYPAYAPWIDRWRTVVDAVLSQPPPWARPDKLEIHQVLPARGGDVPQAVLARLERSPALPTHGAIVADDRWGRGSEEGAYAMGLAILTASRVVGLPDSPDDTVLREEDVESLSDRAYPPGELTPGQPWGACHVLGQARAVVALWLAARATPGGPERLRRLVGPAPYGIQVHEQRGSTGLSETGPFLWELNNLPFGQRVPTNGPYIEWGLADAYYALQMLERPQGQVAATLQESWAHLTAPSTPTEELVRVFDLRVMPSVEEQFRQAGLDPALVGEILPESEWVYNPPCR